jgi:hypothetical protein
MVGLGVPVVGQTNVIDLPNVACTIVSFSAPIIQGGTSKIIAKKKCYFLIKSILLTLSCIYRVSVPAGFVAVQ